MPPQPLHLVNLCRLVHHSAATCGARWVIKAERQVKFYSFLAPPALPPFYLTPLLATCVCVCVLCIFHILKNNPTCKRYMKLVSR